jgi:hypothetical protein
MIARAERLRNGGERVGGERATLSRDMDIFNDKFAS